jgi:hypothetical protein
MQSDKQRTVYASPSAVWEGKRSSYGRTTSHRAESLELAYLLRIEPAAVSTVQSLAVLNNLMGFL